MMIIREANLEDAKTILEIQKLAFSIQGKLYNDNNLPPLIQSIEELEVDFLKYTFLIAILNKRIVGSVKVEEKEDNSCSIGRLIVHPDFQNKGIGTKLMHSVEEFFNNNERFELFTGHKSEKSLYLYNKLGYRELKIEKVNDYLNHIYLEKRIID
ncbi:MAG: GNAT family N-acetyltransferase [archaeon]|nr:GNAT family N-acetyltransferase [archaeon]